MFDDKEAVSNSLLKCCCLIRALTEQVSIAEFWCITKGRRQGRDHPNEINFSTLAHRKHGFSFSMFLSVTSRF